MKNANGLYGRLHRIVGVLALVAVLAAGLSMDVFSIVSHADSTAKITANTAKVREEASTSSNTLASVKKGDTVTVKNQTQASDGYTWYQVVYDGTKTGYIRSDLLEITDGSTPGTSVPATTGQTTGSTSNTSAGDEAVVAVNDVQPVSAKVSGSSPVRVRQNASTTSRIVSTAQGGLAMTVDGTASGTDGNEWYRVTFISNGSEVTGFVRADYVTLDGELVAAGAVATPTETTEPVQQETETKTTDNGSTTVDGSKAWDTYYQDDVWHLVDNTSGKSYSIDQIFETVKKNNETLTQVIDTNQKQQIAVVALVILVVLLICGISVLFFKLKEVKDDAYYEKVERETVRRRTEEKPATNGARVGAAGESGAKSNGKRPSGQQADHPHTGNKRPNGQNSGGQHTKGANGSGKRPSGQKPSGQRRPADEDEAVRRKRPEEKRPAESRTVSPQSSVEKHEDPDLENTQDMRFEAVQESVMDAAVRESSAEKAASMAATEEEKNLQNSFTQNIEEAAKEIAREMGDPVSAKPAEKKWKSKNFADDDEFEFQFLDWDEDQE